jgi:glycine cleavage system H protein
MEVLQMNPADLIYTKDHEWAKVDGRKARIGLTAYAQEHLGDIVFVDLPLVGKEIRQGEQLCVVESVKAASDVYAPLSGAVVEVNEALFSTPEKINQDPFGEGWVVILEISDPSESAKLMNAADYDKLLAAL